ncbi:hypothetical protein K0504_07710 [Neiella marina]|uniref:Uncharacterized protein n=1 Tax=Neiella holothuriorum TaxID=2870530 RepID=A0ABS7EFD1_9GAMM|nr:hypothetical protein [Neiella holothuriorum]MBW8190919.1 hypothetical protein [Neiella holothuriorum]
MTIINRKRIALLSGIFGLLSVSSVSAVEHTSAEQHLINVAGKAIYMNEHCGTDIEKEKFFEVAKLSVFANGIDSSDMANVDWQGLQTSAHRAYYDYAVANPDGKACNDLLDRSASVLPLIEKRGMALDMDLEMEQEMVQ